MVEVGDVVTFVDSVGKEHDALLTAVWRNSEANMQWFYDRVAEDDTEENRKNLERALQNQKTPSVNLVIISKDVTKTDTYGRQMERYTSQVHKSNQFAHGNYWKEKNQ